MAVSKGICGGSGFQQLSPDGSRTMLSPAALLEWDLLLYSLAVVFFFSRWITASIVASALD